MGIKRTSLVGLALLIGGFSAVNAVNAVAESLDSPPYGYTAFSSADCTAEYPVFETFEDGSAGCYREAEPEWQPGEYERIMLNDPEYDQQDVLDSLDVTYEEAVAFGWIAGGEYAPEDTSEQDHSVEEPTTEPTTAKPGLPKAGV